MRYYVIGVEDDEYPRLIEECSRVVKWAHNNLRGEIDWNSGTPEWLIERLSEAAPSQGDTA